MSIDLRGLHQQVRPYAEYTLDLAHAYGLQPVITSTFRSWEDQRRLYGRWRRGRSDFPANPPGQSAHGHGLAFDSWVPEEDLPLWTAIREYVGWRVPSNDAVHAEVPGWRKLLQ